MLVCFKKQLSHQKSKKAMVEKCNDFSHDNNMHVHKKQFYMNINIAFTHTHTHTYIYIFF